MRHNRIAVVVVIENIQRPGVFPSLQQLHTPCVGRIELRGVDRILDHALAAQVVAEIHGPQMRIEFRADTGIRCRIALPDHPLPKVGILLRSDKRQNLVSVRQLPASLDKSHQFLPVLGHPAHGQHGVDPLSVTLHEVSFQRLGPPSCQPLVRRVAALGRGGRRKRHDIDAELLLPDDAAHQVGDLVQLAAVVAQRIHHLCAADMKPDVAAVGDGDIFIYDTDAVARQSIDEREHRGDNVGERIGRRQPAGAVVDADDLAFECHGHALRGFVRWNLFRIVVGHHAAALDDGIEPCILRVRKLHEAVECCLPPESVGPEAFDIGFVLPVIALLQEREPPAPNYEVFQLHASVWLVQHGRNDHAAAASQQRLGQRDDEVQHHTSITFGHGAHLRDDGYLLDLK